MALKYRLAPSLPDTSYLEYRERITTQAREASLLRTQASPAALQWVDCLSIKQGNAQFAALIHYLSGFAVKRVVSLGIQQRF
jgi:hypothetical protein